ncbi:MAG TPA: immunoglobulin-like domain-containing protein [Clostridia bacterium]|nr:immunoglobulin-like domain-containing protein [Clostridia bacterium]
MNKIKRTMTIFISILMVISFVPEKVDAAGLEYIDLSTWEQKSSANNGIWTLEPGNRTITQSKNGSPTFYVSPEDTINKVVQGTIQVKTTSDDDFIGFVFGFKEPSGISTSPNDYYLFDWKQSAQSGADPGYRLMRVNSSSYVNTWSLPYAGIELIAENTGTGKGWLDNTLYTFKLIYGTNRIKILIDDEVIFDVAAEGSFQTGKFGFYNYSQAYVEYGTVQEAPASFVPVSPVATDDSYGMDKSTSLTVDRFSGIFSNDYDPNLDTYTMELISSVSNGSLSLNSADGSFTYTPNEGYEGVDTFSYRLTDSSSMSSEIATVSISVQEPNVAPTDITIDNDEISMDAADDATVGYLSTVDGNTNDSFDYLLLDSVGGCFGISGNELYVKDASLLEYGTMSPQIKTVDLRGLSHTKTFSVSVVDNTNPSSPSISVNPTSWTNSATISITPGTDSGSGVEKTEYKIDEGEWTNYSSPFSYSVDGEHTVEARTYDNAGNFAISGTTEIKIDGTNPTAPSISVDPMGWTTGSAAITVAPGTDSGSGVQKTEYRIDSGAWTLYTDKVTLEEDGEHTIEARTLDNAGNSASSEESTVRIDNTSPSEPSISIDPEAWTSGSALVTIIPGADSGSGVSKTEYALGSGDWTEYNEAFYVSTEGALCIYARTLDNVGNSSGQASSESKIDRTGPIVSIEDYSTDWTNQNFTVSASDEANDGFSLVSFNSESHEFTTNGSFTFTATDEAGNTDSEEVTITNIDKTLPSIDVSGTIPTEWTSSSAFVTWSAFDSQSYGWTELPNGTTSSALSGTYEIEENGSHVFTAVDLAGNTAGKTVSVTKIDKIAPDISIAEYSTEWTNGDITVSASDSANDGLSNVLFNATSHEFTTNGSFTFIATDEAGNKDSETVEISKIDKTDPVITIKGDNPYKIDLNETYTDQGASASDDASGLDGDVTVSSTVDTAKLGTYSVTYTVNDTAGNWQHAVRTVEVREQLKVSWDGLESKGDEAAAVKGKIESLGSSNDVTRYGFIWVEGNDVPTFSDDYCELTVLDGPGSYNYVVRDLSSNTIYSIRAYAEDSTSLRYGEVKTFKTEKKPVKSVTVSLDPEKVEPEKKEDGNEVYDLRSKTSVPEVTNTVDGDWIAEQNQGKQDEDEEGGTDGKTVEGTVLEFGTYKNSISLPVSELLSGNPEEKEEGEERDEPVSLANLEVTVRRENLANQNTLLAGVPEEQRADRKPVSPVVTYEVTAAMSDGNREKISDFDSYVERKISVPNLGVADVSNLLAVRIDEKTGEYVPVPASFTPNPDGTIVANISDCATGSYMVIENNCDYESGFPENHWAAEMAVKMSKKLMLEEVFDDEMKLDAGITRAEMSGVLLKTLGINKNSIESDAKFEDLPEGSKWHNTVLAATEAGILKGYGDGNVKPEQVISREEMAAVIFRTMDRMIEIAEERDKVIYEDHDVIKAWALGQVNALTDIEVFVGYESGTFMPDSDIKVGEALTALYRMSRHLNFID